MSDAAFFVLVCLALFGAIVAQEVWAGRLTLASRMEAQRDETENTGSTAEGGDSLTAESGDAQTVPTPSSRERK